MLNYALQSFDQQSFDGSASEEKVFIADSASNFVDQSLLLLSITAENILHQCEGHGFEA